MPKLIRERFLLADNLADLGVGEEGQVALVGADFYYWDGTTWINLSSGGAITFLNLTDTPSSYTGSAGYVVKVNPTETGLEFSPLSISFLDLTDTPSSYPAPGWIARVNATNDGIEFVDGSTIYVLRDGDTINTSNSYTWNVSQFNIVANSTSEGVTIDNTNTGPDMKVGIIRASGTKPNMIFGDAWLEFWHPTLNSVLWNIRNDGQARFFAGAAYSGQLEIYTGMTVWNEATIRGDPGVNAPQIRFNDNAIHVEFNKTTDEFLITMVPSQTANPLIIEDDLGTAKFEINPQGQIETYTPRGYAYSYDTTQQVIAAANTWQDVSFDTDVLADDITRPNATDFVFGSAGVYEVSLSLNVRRSGAPGGVDMGARLNLDGAEVAGSQMMFNMNDNNTTYTISKSILINANAGSTLKAQIAATATNARIFPDTQLGITTPTSATITIKRVI